MSTSESNDDTPDEHYTISQKAALNVGGWCLVGIGVTAEAYGIAEACFNQSSGYGFMVLGGLAISSGAFIRKYPEIRPRLLHGLLNYIYKPQD